MVAVADSPDEPPMPPGLDQPQPDSIQGAGPGSPKRHWITQWQTIVVAIIAATASIGVALIGVKAGDTGNRPESSDGNISFTSGTPLLDPVRPHEVTISSVQISAAPNGGRVFTVTGDQGIPRIDDYVIHIIGRPVNARSVLGSYAWYASEPANLGSDGSWVARMEIDSSEMRDIVVQAVVTVDTTGGVLSPSDSSSVAPFHFAVSYPMLAGPT